MFYNIIAIFISTRTSEALGFTEQKLETFPYMLIIFKYGYTYQNIFFTILMA